MPVHATQRLAGADPVMKQLIARLPEPTIRSTHDVFFDLMSCVIEQQIHYRSTKQVFQKMLQRASLLTLSPDNFSHFEEKALADTKLSLTKYQTIVQILDFWENNQINWVLLSDEEVREKLSAIKGVGEWTIDMILLYTLERPGIFPSSDFHLKQAMIQLYGLNPCSRLKAQMLSVASTWGEHQSLAVHYLLAWKAGHKTRQLEEMLGRN